MTLLSPDDGGWGGGREGGRVAPPLACAFPPRLRTALKCRAEEGKTFFFHPQESKRGGRHARGDFGGGLKNGESVDPQNRIQGEKKVLDMPKLPPLLHQEPRIMAISRLFYGGHVVYYE